MWENINGNVRSKGVESEYGDKKSPVTQFMMSWAIKIAQ